MPNGRSPTTSESVELVSQRVSQLSDQVSSLARSFDGFASKVDGRLTATDDRIANQVATLRQEMAESQVQAAKARIPQWQVIASVLASCVVMGITVTGALWAAGIGPIKDANDKQDRILEKLVEKVVTKDDLEYRLTVSGKRRDEQFLDLKAAQEAVRKEMREDAEKIVPRGEHARWWAQIEQQLQDKQRQIDEIKSAQGSTYGVRDVIQRLEKQVEDLREEKYRAQRASGP